MSRIFYQMNNERLQEYSKFGKIFIFIICDYVELTLIHAVIIILFWLI